MTTRWYTGYDGLDYPDELEDKPPKKRFIYSKAHEPYPKSLGCECDRCEQGREQEKKGKNDNATR